MKKSALLIGIWLVCVVCALFALPRMLWAAFTNPDKAWDMAKAWDRLGNAATNGKWNEFVSSRASRARREGRRWGCFLCGLLDELEQNHCENSEKSEATT